MESFPIIPVPVKLVIDCALICAGIYLNKKTLDEDLAPVYPCVGGILLATGSIFLIQNCAS